MSYEYKATVVRWIDGDTVELVVDVGFHITYRDHFRLIGIDTPERGRPGAAEAHARAEALAPVGTEVMIATEKSDKYGRWLANVYPDAVPIVSNQRTVNGILIAEGLAKLYWGGTKDAS